jgi:hypothetical protein
MVSNSGRLAAHLRQAARDWPFPVEVVAVQNADPLLARADFVVTSDGAILDTCVGWLGLAGWIVRRELPDAWRFDLLPTEEFEAHK